VFCARVRALRTRTRSEEDVRLEKGEMAGRSIARCSTKRTDGCRFGKRIRSEKMQRCYVSTGRPQVVRSRKERTPNSRI
jgi:hypothetical protein